jgi:hypothetical protein
MVAYGGPTLAQNHLQTPYGSCNADLQSKGSFYHGKILRMGHYAVILQPYFRLNRRVDQLASKWLAMSV